MTTVPDVPGDGDTGVRQPAFTGRERELAALRQALERPAAVVLIDGEAGIGKTRLVRQFLDSPAGKERRGLVVGCPPLRQPQTLGPVTDTLRQAVPSVAGLGLSGLGGALRALFPEWSDDLPPSPEAAEDPSAARYRVFAALAELLARLELTVLVAEDVHWADEATLEFLLFLAARQPQEVTLVLTYRAAEVPEGSLLPRLSRLAASGAGLRMSLTPLDSAETGGMVSSMLEGEPVSHEFAAFVHERTDGVPLAVEESVRVMVGRRDLVREDGTWVRHALGEIMVPPTIRDSVQERFARLGGDAQSVLRAAAVVADPVAETLLGGVAALGHQRFQAGLDEALDCGLLTEDGSGLVSFRHALACRAVYESIPVSRRRALHLRAGEMLERTSPTPAAQLARHFREAGESARWCQYAEATADIALATGDEATAFDLLHELITSGVLPAGSVARLARRLPLVSFIPFSRYQDLASALRAVLHAPAANLGLETEGEIRYQLGRILFASGDMELGCAEFEQAIPNLSHDPVQAAWAMILMAYPAGVVRHASDHLRWLHRAATVAAEAEMPPGDRLQLAVDHFALLLMLGQEEGWAEAARIPAREGTTPRERQEITRAHLLTGVMAIVWGRYRDAARSLDSAQDAAGRYQYLRHRETALIGRAHLSWLTGIWEGLAQRVRPMTDDDEVRSGLRCEAALVMGLLEAATGARRQAEERLRFALDGYRNLGDVLNLADPAAALARLWLADGRVDDALGVTDEPVEILSRKGIWILATDLVPARVTALVAAGRGGEAAELVSAFEAGIKGRNAPASHAALVLCHAILAEADGDHAGAAARYGQAATAWQALPRPYDALLAQEHQAACLLRCAQPEAGISLLQAVVQGLSRLGARNDALRVIETLQRHGVRVSRPWWGGRQGYGGKLSPRELDVVRLLTDGRTNRDIAQALFISPKTVACHLDSARRKLGLPSRTALAVWATETAER